MQDAEDYHITAGFNRVGDDERRVWHDELPRALNASWAPKSGMIGE